MEPKELASAITTGIADASADIPPIQIQFAATSPTATTDEPLWTAVRSTSNTLDFGLYQNFVARVFDPDAHSGPSNPLGLSRFFGVESYQMLKFATQAFLILQSNLGVRPGGATANPIAFTPGFAADERARGKSWTLADAKTLLGEYLGNDKRLPYLDAAVAGICVCKGSEPASPTTASNVKDSVQQSSAQLRPAPTPVASNDLYSRIRESVSGVEPSDTLGHMSSVYDSKNHRMKALVSSNTLLLELIWSFWREEGALVQTMNAISLRFQNRRGPAAHDPLLHLKLDPLRPLSNIIWGYIQDEQNRLTLARRCYEYDNEYGLGLVGKAVPVLRSAESRSKFLEAFNNLLQIAHIYCKESDDMTVRADAFPVLNALKEVHHILAHGAHNQFGDLPWTARVEMLTQQWMLARPEIREFLSGPPMVTYPEPWMGQVETMRQLQGWSDVSVTHFRDLSTFGEMLLLAIRYGNWNSVFNAASAANWARYWRTEIQSYMHSYRAVTGVDLTSDISTGGTRNEQPAVLHRRRVESGRARYSAATRKFNFR